MLLSRALNISWVEVAPMKSKFWLTLCSLPISSCSVGRGRRPRVGKPCCWVRCSSQFSVLSEVQFLCCCTNHKTGKSDTQLIRETLLWPSLVETFFVRSQFYLFVKKWFHSPIHFLKKIWRYRERRSVATQRMDKSSSLVIDPPDGGCRVSFTNKKKTEKKESLKMLPIRHSPTHPPLPP